MKVEVGSLLQIDSYKHGEILRVDIFNSRGTLFEFSRNVSVWMALPPVEEIPDVNRSWRY